MFPTAITLRLCCGTDHDLVHINIGRLLDRVGNRTSNRLRRHRDRNRTSNYFRRHRELVTGLFLPGLPLRIYHAIRPDHAGRNDRHPHLVAGFLAQTHTTTDGSYKTAIPELCFRRATQESEPTHTLGMPSLYLIAQGSKTATLAGESFQIVSETYLVTSVHLPVIGKITQASPQTPYLSLELMLSPDVILDINKKSSPEKRGETGRGILVNPSSPSLLDAVLRLVNLLDTPTDIEMLAPLIIREVFYRVLQGEQGALIRQFAVIGSYAQGFSNAIHLINRDYSKPLVIWSIDAHARLGCCSGRISRRLRKPFPVQPGIRPLIWTPADERY
nr:AraC family transcriptional regulator [Cohnella zeiphila]